MYQRLAIVTELTSKLGVFRAQYPHTAEPYPFIMAFTASGAIRARHEALTQPSLQQTFPQAVCQRIDDSYSFFYNG